MEFFLYYKLYLAFGLQVNWGGRLFYSFIFKKNHFIEVSLVYNEVFLLYNEVFYSEAFLYMCNSFSYSLPLLLLQGIEYSSLCYTMGPCCLPSCV